MGRARVPDASDTATCCAGHSFCVCAVLQDSRQLLGAARAATRGCVHLAAIAAGGQHPCSHELLLSWQGVLGNSVCSCVYTPGMVHIEMVLVASLQRLKPWKQPVLLIQAVQMLPIHAASSGGLSVLGGGTTSAVGVVLLLEEVSALPVVARIVVVGRLVVWQLIMTMWQWVAAMLLEWGSHQDHPGDWWLVLQL